MPEQPKQKKHRSRTLVERFFGARRIDFVTPLSPEECVEQLKGLNVVQNWWFQSPTININIQQIDDDTYQLKLIRKERILRLELIGFVKRWEVDTSRIILTIKPLYVELILAFGVILLITKDLYLILSPFLLVAPILLALYVWILFLDKLDEIQFLLVDHHSKDHGLRTMGLSPLSIYKHHCGPLLERFLEKSG